VPNFLQPSNVAVGRDQFASCAKDGWVSVSSKSAEERLGYPVTQFRWLEWITHAPEVNRYAAPKKLRNHSRLQGCWRKSPTKDTLQHARIGRSHGLAKGIASPEARETKQASESTAGIRI